MAFTVTPSISYTADGSEHVSYDDANVENSDFTEYLGSQGSEYGDYLFDQQTQSYRHRYADIDGEELESRLDSDQGEDQYLYQDDYIAGFQELVGGPEAYNGLISWAANNLSQDEIDEFDEAVGSDDPSVVEAAIEWLYSVFQEQADQEEYYDDEELDPEVDQICDLGYTEEYRGMVSWAADNLDDDAISEFNSAMDSNDPEVMRGYIERLWNLYEAYA